MFLSSPVLQSLPSMQQDSGTGIGGLMSLQSWGPWFPQQCNWSPKKKNSKTPGNCFASAIPFVELNQSQQPRFPCCFGNQSSLGWDLYRNPPLVLCDRQKLIHQLPVLIRRRWPKMLHTKRLAHLKRGLFYRREHSRCREGQVGPLQYNNRPENL